MLSNIQLFSFSSRDPSFYSFNGLYLPRPYQFDAIRKWIYLCFAGSDWYDIRSTLLTHIIYITHIFVILFSYCQAAILLYRVLLKRTGKEWQTTNYWFPFLRFSFLFVPYSRCHVIWMEFHSAWTWFACQLFFSRKVILQIMFSLIMSDSTKLKILSRPSESLE